MFGWFKRKTLSEVVHERKKLTVYGIPFVIKKINTFNFLDGSKAMIQVYDTYKANLGTGPDMTSSKKLVEHYRDVIMAGVVSPKLTRKKGEEGFFVDELFENPELMNAVYTAIIEFTYGKKKVKSLRSRGNV